MLLFKLFYSFAKIGLFTFGGGYAMLPMFQRELVEKNQWITEDELMDYYAISQCTPGIIAINAATLTGYNVAGTLGAIFATLGASFPSLVIITAIAAFIQGFADNIYVKNAFAGIRVCVCVLILNAVIKLWKSAIKDWFGIAVFCVVLALTLFTDISKVLLIIAAGLAGLIMSAVKRRSLK